MAKLICGRLDYLKANELLNGKDQRKLGHNTYLVDLRDVYGWIGVKYHDTYIIRFYDDHWTVLTGGHLTLTTKDRLNKLMPHGHISQKDWIWYWEDGREYLEGKSYPYIYQYRGYDLIDTRWNNKLILIRKGGINYQPVYTYQQAHERVDDLITAEQATIPTVACFAEPTERTRFKFQPLKDKWVINDTVDGTSKFVSRCYTEEDAINYTKLLNLANDDVVIRLVKRACRIRYMDCCEAWDIERKAELYY